MTRGSLYTSLLAIILCLAAVQVVYAQVPVQPYPYFSNSSERTAERQLVSPQHDARHNTPDAGNIKPYPAAYPVRPAPDQVKEKKHSAIESMYARRIVDELGQFGYDLFGVPDLQTQSALDTLAASDRGNTNRTPSGAVQDDFVLNTGDELEIMFTGQRTDRDIYTVNTQGTLLINDLPPIPAAGRTIGQVRISIEAAARNLHNTEAHVSLSSVRQIGVLVAGHVKKPGKQTMTVFHTVLDVLMSAGGVEKTGSLRQIKLVRDGRSQIIDIYGLLLHGAVNMDLNLRDGDRIIVPPIGPTVAIAGETKRTGIFEILPRLKGMHHKPETRSEYLTLNDMLSLAGGVLSPGQNRFLKLGLDDAGQEMVSEVEEAFDPLFGDGTILMVSKGEAKRAGMVELTGHTRRPGLYALSENQTLSALLPDDRILGEDIYPLIGVIERWNEKQLTHEIFDFPLRLVLKGDYDRKLQDGDVIHLFPHSYIMDLQKSVHGDVPADQMAQGSYSDDSTENEPDRVIDSFLRERSVFVRGAVRSPGPYPVAEGTSLDSVVAVAGGLTLEANTGNIEITSDRQGTGHQAYGRSGTQRMTVNFREDDPQNIMLTPGDSVRVNRTFKKVDDKSVLIAGEVLNPGRYDLIPGDKLSDLLERAGGFTRDAYPDGTVFSRDRERRAEEARFKQQARSIKRSVALALEADDEKVGEGKIAEARALADELDMAEGIGRITVEGDLAMLKAQPELDVLLESGDRIFIPKRTLNVRVSGEVLSPASLQFRDNKAPLDYIHEAGGFTFHADKDRAFVLYPDGSAQPLQVSVWNHSATFIPPGSTIFVPRDPKPFDFVDSAKDISQILSNLAISAIFIDDVRDD